MPKYVQQSFVGIGRCFLSVDVVRGGSSCACLEEYMSACMLADMSMFRPLSCWGLWFALFALLTLEKGLGVSLVVIMPPATTATDPSLVIVSKVCFSHAIQYQYWYSCTKYLLVDYRASW